MKVWERREIGKVVNGVDLVSEHAPYPKAPITEAVIDIRVTLPEHTSVADLARVNIGEDVTLEERSSAGDRNANRVRLLRLGT